MAWEHEDSLLAKVMELLELVVNLGDGVLLQHDVPSPAIPRRQNGVMEFGLRVDVRALEGEAIRVLYIIKLDYLSVCVAGNLGRQFINT